MTDSDLGPDALEWRVDVTDDDVRAARRAWRAARAEDPGSARTAELHRSFERLVRTQARQLSERLQLQMQRRRGL